jgi:hypothetical protein
MSFTIPVDKGVYYSGQGILYALLLEQTWGVTIRRTFTNEQLSQIVESLAQEVGMYNSSTRLDADEFE